MVCKVKLYVLLPVLVCLAACHAEYPGSEEEIGKLPEQVDFNFHIKPILSDRCFACHGPDQNALKADLRLDLPETALKQKLSSGKYAFVPRKINQSEAFQRMISKDPDRQMPPPSFNRHLSNYEIALLAKWIEQGAEYKPHWAFIPLKKPRIPKVNHQAWCRNEMDYFVLHGLEQHGLIPNREAKKELWLRRVTLDLTGIPPTIEEIDAFIADDSPIAYERVVDRLLASSHYGEKMALHWLDLARYADSNGYSQDGLRIMWPWRDWLIQAFHNNMSYDQFLTWQIAGDQLPEATQDQKLATGFLRNHRQNGEGGIIDEEYRVEYVADRTETMATVFLGLTLQCARCHDHKYDPISQKEYYQLFSFFNQINEVGITANDGNSGPELVLTNEEVREQITFIDSLIQIKEKEAAKIHAGIPPENVVQAPVNLEKGLVLDLSFDQYNDQKVFHDLVPSQAFDIIGEVTFENGKSGKAIKTDGYHFLQIREEKIEFDRGDPFSISFYVFSQHGAYNLSLLNHLGSKGDNFPGYEIAIDNGHAVMRFIHSYPAHQLEVRTKEQVPKSQWLHYTFTYDGSGKAAGIQIYQDGQLVSQEIVHDHLDQGFANNKKRLTVGGRRPYQVKHDGFTLIDELKVHNRTLSAVEAAALLTKHKPDDISKDNWKMHYLFSNHASYQKIQQEIQDLRKQKFTIQDTLISVMIMEDMAIPRPTYVLSRGVYDAPEEEVQAGTPAAISAQYEKSVQDRLDLAHWLVDTNHPLTARVAVNRFWKYLFGRGIVHTTDDFGNQGSLPTHPELLDWLAMDFIKSGWDIKALLRKMVLSATYRQSSQVSEAARTNDPNNERLARGPSHRLSAELIRDLALAASGLLTPQVGGPSVMPYQPKGLWAEKGEFSKLKFYEQSHGDHLYRKSLYTFWRRTAPPPSMIVFDAPTRDICIANRQATNTPLQALVMLNDPQFVEAARILAERVINHTSEKSTQITLAYRLLTGLMPPQEVITPLLALYQKEYQKYQNADSQRSALLQVGEYPADQTLDQAAIAAMTIVCSTIMSFDETIMKR